MIQTADARMVDLQQGFAAFVEAARRLELSHAELKARADAVDVQLAETNTQLAYTLAERDAVFAALPLGVVALDSKGAMTFCNEEGGRLLGRAAKAKPTGMDLLGVPEGPVETPDWSVVVRRVHRPGTGDLVLIEDRSRVAKLEREVDRLDRLAGLSELALGIAHEIRNPLNGVLGFSALLERQQDPERIRFYGRKIIEGLAIVDQIVREMLGFARSTCHSASRAPLHHVVHEAAAAAQVPLARVTLCGDRDAQVDAAALIRVLSNLFRNAVEAGGADTRLKVESTARAHEQEILVMDDGPGISMELSERLFRPFVTTKERGHGLGLALAARVVAFLNGRLELANPGARGAVFRIRLPRLLQVEVAGG